MSRRGASAKPVVSKPKDEAVWGGAFNRVYRSPRRYISRRHDRYEWAWLVADRYESMVLRARQNGAQS